MKTYEEIIDGCKMEINTNAIGVLARISVDFVDPPIIIKGFTLKDQIDKAGKPFILLSAPSYRGKYKFSPITWMPEGLWRMLSEKAIAEYGKLETVEEDELMDLDKVEL